MMNTNVSEPLPVRAMERLENFQADCRKIGWGLYAIAWIIEENVTWGDCEGHTPLPDNVAGDLASGAVMLAQYLSEQQERVEGAIDDLKKANSIIDSLRR